MKREEDTFSELVPGIQAFRDAHRDDSWSEWRQMVLMGIKAGAALEKDFAEFKSAIQGRVASIEKDKGLLATIARALWQVALIALAAYAGHQWKSA